VKILALVTVVRDMAILLNLLISRWLILAILLRLLLLLLRLLLLVLLVLLGVVAEIRPPVATIVGTTSGRPASGICVLAWGAGIRERFCCLDSCSDDVLGDGGALVLRGRRFESFGLHIVFNANVRELACSDRHLGTHDMTEVGHSLLCATICMWGGKNFCCEIVQGSGEMRKHFLCMLQGFVEFVIQPCILWPRKIHAWSGVLLTSVFGEVDGLCENGVFVRIRWSTEEVGSCDGGTDGLQLFRDNHKLGGWSVFSVWSGILRIPESIDLDA